MSRHRPPRLARRLLRLLVPGEIGESLAGDLEERFQRLVGTDPRRARLDYWKDVLSPSVLRLRKEIQRLPNTMSGRSPTSIDGDGPVHEDGRSSPRRKRLRARIRCS